MALYDRVGIEAFKMYQPWGTLTLCQVKLRLAGLMFPPIGTVISGVALAAPPGTARLALVKVFGGRDDVREGAGSDWETPALVANMLIKPSGPV